MYMYIYALAGKNATLENRVPGSKSIRYIKSAISGASSKMGAGTIQSERGVAHFAYLPTEVTTSVLAPAGRGPARPTCTYYKLRLHYIYTSQDDKTYMYTKVPASWTALTFLVQQIVI